MSEAQTVDPWVALYEQSAPKKTHYDNMNAKFKLDIYELRPGQRVGRLLDTVSPVSDFALRVTMRMPTGTKTQLNGMQVGGELQWVRNEKARTLKFVIRMFL